MDLEIFHNRLLGNTPERYRLTTRHQALYTGYRESDVRGFASEDDQPDLFLATLVLALGQTQGEKPVVLLVPKPRLPWVSEQIKETARHVFQLRKTDAAGVAVMRRAFQCLHFAKRPAQLTAEPPHWAIFGFGPNAILPLWAEGRLMPTPPEVSV